MAHGRRAGDSSDGMLLSMAGSGKQSAVCVVKVDQQPFGLIITVTVADDIMDERSESSRQFARTGDALQAVARFLESFVDDER